MLKASMDGFVPMTGVPNNRHLSLRGLLGMLASRTAPARLETIESQPVSRSGRWIANFEGAYVLLSAKLRVKELLQR